MGEQLYSLLARTFSGSVVGRNHGKNAGDRRTDRAGCSGNINLLAPAPSAKECPDRSGNIPTGVVSIEDHLQIACGRIDRSVVAQILNLVLSSASMAISMWSSTFAASACLSV